MKCVYEASTGLDAHMIADLLAQQRIEGRIEGEYLQGGIGGIQAMGLVRVLVSESDFAAARKIISEWESLQPSPQFANPEPRAAGGIQIFVIGAITGAGVMYWLLKGPH